MKTAVLIVEDQAMPRQLLEIFVESSHQYVLAGSIADAEMAPAFCRNRQVDLILMDVMTELGSSGLLAAEKIKKEFPGIRIIIVTSMPEFSWIKRAREIGVESFWYKDAARESILSVMDRTMAGVSVYPEDTPLVPVGLTDNHSFSERELEILRELMTGESNAEIAQRMGISAGTIKRHVENMLIKTGFHTRTELVAEAGRLGIVIRDK